MSADHVAPAPARLPPPTPGPPPRFSVVIPAYRAAATVASTIASALAQTAPAHEVIVVDDGSPDDTAEIAAATSPAVRVERIGHAGEAAARNAGARLARSEFVAYLDADDRYEPRFLEAVGHLAAVRPDLDVVTADAVFETPEGPRGTFYGSNPFPVDDQRRAILRSCFLTTLSAVRTTRISDVGGFDETLVQAADWDFWIRLVLDGSRVGLVAEPLSRYRIHPGQASARRSESLRARATVLEKTLATATLTPDERRLVEELLPGLRERAATASALEAPSRAAARRRWVAIAADRRLSRRGRTLGVVGCAAPGLAARRARAGGESGGR